MHLRGFALVFAAILWAGVAHADQPAEPPAVDEAVGLGDQAMAGGFCAPVAPPPTWSW